MTFQGEEVEEEEEAGEEETDNHSEESSSSAPITAAAGPSAATRLHCYTAHWTLTHVHTRTHVHTHSAATTELFSLVPGRQISFSFCCSAAQMLR